MNFPKIRRSSGEALYLLERGADPLRVAGDGTTLAKMLIEHREQFSRDILAPPREFALLWAWAESHGLLSQP